MDNTLKFSMSFLVLLESFHILLVEFVSSESRLKTLNLYISISL